jgi:hypothetical protein
MDTLLLGITVVSLIVALLMSVTAWRLMRDEKRRSAARIAALSTASFGSPEPAEAASVSLRTPVGSDVPADQFPELPIAEPAVEHRIARAPWKPAAPIGLGSAVEMAEPPATHSTGFLASTSVARDTGGRQRSLAIAAFVLFAIMSGGLVWMMSGPEGTSAVAVGPNSPLELVSLSHARQNEKLAVSGLVRNPVSGQPVERLSAVVFLFDRAGTFVTSSRAHVDFLKLGAGDESPFVVSIDAPPTVSRYRVSFRTDDGVVPHIDRRGESPAPAEGEQPIAVTAR